jgi:hypothetical protein
MSFLPVEKLFPEMQELMDLVQLAGLEPQAVRVILEM